MVLKILTILNNLIIHIFMIDFNILRLNVWTWDTGK